MPMLRVVPWVLIVALVAFTGATYGTLPALIPQRLNAAGTPTAFMTASLFVWFLIPLIAVVVQLMLAGVSAAVERRPQLFNFPEKDRFLRLPDRYRAPVVAEMRSLLDVTSICVTGTLCLAQWAIWRAARGATGPSGMILILISSAIVVPIVLVYLPRLTAATAAAERRWHEEDPAAKPAATQPRP